MNDKGDASPNTRAQLDELVAYVTGLADVIEAELGDEHHDRQIIAEDAVCTLRDMARQYGGAS